MSLILLLHLFLSIVQCHTMHTASPSESNVVFYYIHDPQPPKSKSQATCKLQHTIPLLSPYKRRPPSPTLLLIIYSIKIPQPPDPQTAPIPLHLPPQSSTYPPTLLPPLPLFIMCYIEAS